MLSILGIVDFQIPYSQSNKALRKKMESEVQITIEIANEKFATTIVLQMSSFINFTYQIKQLIKSISDIKYIHGDLDVFLSFK